jgi:hypothetical protein
MKTQTGFTFLTTLIGLPIFLGVLLLVSIPSLAATITVDNFLDNTTQDRNCTFREALENALLFVLGNTDPGIRDGKADAHAFRAGVKQLAPQRDLASRGELDGIAHEIHKHLPEATWVAEQRRMDLAVD